MPLSDDALVVRGGSLRDPEKVRDKVLDAVDDGDGPVLSVYCAEPLEGESRDDLVRRICTEADFPHSKVQVGKVGDIRQNVTDLYQETSSGEVASHYHVLFTDDVALSEVEGFVASLGDPEPNPIGSKP